MSRNPFIDPPTGAAATSTIQPDPATVKLVDDIFVSHNCAVKTRRVLTVHREIRGRPTALARLTWLPHSAHDIRPQAATALPDPETPRIPRAQDQMGPGIGHTVLEKHTCVVIPNPLS